MKEAKVLNPTTALRQKLALSTTKSNASPAIYLKRPHAVVTGQCDDLKKTGDT